MYCYFSPKLGCYLNFESVHSKSLMKLFKSLIDTLELSLETLKIIQRKTDLDNSTKKTQNAIKHRLYTIPL